MNEHPRIKTEPSFFSGVRIETNGIAASLVSLRETAAKAEDMMATTLATGSIAALKATIETVDALERQMQADLNRARTLNAHLDRKLAAFQSRRPR